MKILSKGLSKISCSCHVDCYYKTGQKDTISTIMPQLLLFKCCLLASGVAAENLAQKYSKLEFKRIRCRLARLKAHCKKTISRSFQKYQTLNVLEAVFIPVANFEKVGYNTRYSQHWKIQLRSDFDYRRVRLHLRLCF